MKRWVPILVGVTFLLYARTLDDFFVSDDFLNFERNGFETPGDALAFFATSDVDFWRPLSRLHFGILRGLAGDGVVAWHVVGVALHALAAWLVMLLAASLLGQSNRRAAPWAGLFFAVHFVHVEPVVWISSVTSLWVTVLVLAALVAFRRGRRSLAVVAFAAALAAKETAVAFAPLLLLTTWWWPVERDRARWPRISEWLPFAILLAAWASVLAGVDRGGAASPYRVAFGAHVVKNAAFVLLGGFVPLRYWEIRDLGAGADGLGPFVAALAGRPDLAAGVLLGAAGIGALVARGGRDVRGALLWMLAAATPFLLLTGSGERFLYLPSVGASLVWGIGAARVLGWGEARRRRVAARLAVAAAVALHVTGNLDRQRDWGIAAAWTHGIAARWSALESRDPDEPLEIVGVPDEWRSAWVFRNGFDSMVRLYWRGRPYAREGQLPAGTPPAERLAVVVHANGTVGMLPERLLRRP